MPFKAKIIHNYTKPYETRIFQQISKDLYNKYDSSEDLVVLIGNITIEGNYIDALLLKRHCVAIIDFKNYGGQLEFSENGNWYINNGYENVEVRGGNNSNPLKQIISYKRGFEKHIYKRCREYFIIKNINFNSSYTSCIVLFHQKINFNEFKEIPQKYPFLSIIDISIFLDRIETIFNEGQNLNNEDIEFIVNSLHVKLDDEIYVELNKTISEPIENKGVSYVSNYTTDVKVDEITQNHVEITENDNGNETKSENQINETYENKPKLWVFGSLLIVLTLMFLTYYSLIYHKPITNVITTNKTIALYLNDNFDKSELDELIEEKSHIKVFNLVSVLNLKKSEINKLLDSPVFIAQDNPARIKEFFQYATYNDIDSILILGDLGNIKNQLVYENEIESKRIIKKEFWDTLKSRNNSFFKILNSNKKSNLQELIEKRQNEKLNN